MAKDAVNKDIMGNQPNQNALLEEQVVNLMRAASNNDIQAILSLKSAGLDIQTSYEGNTAMHHAACSNSCEAIWVLATFSPKLLIEEDKKGYSPLKVAQYFKRQEAEQDLQDLISLSKTYLLTKRNLIHQAVINNRPHLIHILATFFDIAQFDIRGEAPIHYATINNNYTAIKDICAVNPHLINQTTILGKTPLRLAEDAKNYAMCEFIKQMNGIANLQAELSTISAYPALEMYFRNKILAEKNAALESARVV